MTNGASSLGIPYVCGLAPRLRSEALGSYEFVYRASIFPSASSTPSMDLVDLVAASFPLIPDRPNK